MSDWDDLNGDEAHTRLYREINKTAEPYPQFNLAVLFEQQATRHPQRTAVVHGRRRLSYAELNGRANLLARRLRADGVRHGDAVGVDLERSIGLVVAMLAIVKCGGAYLALHTDWPAERLRRLTAVSGCRHVVTQSQVDATVGMAPNISATARPQDIAYINFTSASTGTPKGVPIQHRSVVALLHAARYARLGANTAVSQLAPATFDAAAFEIWAPLLHGGRCVLYPSAPVTVAGLRETLPDVTITMLPTALFHTIVDEAPDLLDTVETVLINGGATSRQHIRTALERYGPDKLVSVYGSTETASFAAYHPIRESPGADVLPIGRPIQHTRLYVADNGKLCGPGETGELLLAGASVSPGYLALPETTAKRFVPTVVDGRAEIVYRTGESAWLRDDGNVVRANRATDPVPLHRW